MRTRWHVDDDWGYALFMVWFVIGVVWLFLAVAPTTPTVFVVLAWAWGGVVLIPAALVGAFCFLRFLWRERPRRVSEPVTTDLRETL